MTAGTAIDPSGWEIGGFVAHLIQRVIDYQFGTVSFSIQGIQGTSPSQAITAQNAITGIASVKSFIDSYTDLAFDDDPYPNAPLRYEYAQRDQHFIWRKQESLINGSISLRLTLGKDAILDGMVSTMPLYTDVIATPQETSYRYHHADRDSSRRWGGRRFIQSVTSTGTFLTDAQELAVRSGELFKLEQVSFSILTSRDAFLLHPGDLISLWNAEAFGLTSGNYRVSEVDIQLSPTSRTRIVVGEKNPQLTDYL